MKIWLPELGRVYKTAFNYQECYIRFTAYGVSNASSGRPIDLSFGIYEDIDCKNAIKNNEQDFNQYWANRDKIYACEFEDTGVVIEKLGKPKKIPTTIEELLHALSLKSNRHSNMDITIVFRDIVAPSWFYSYNRVVGKNDNGTYRYFRPGRNPSTGVESFTAEDVVEMSGKVLGKYFRYAEGVIVWK